MRSDNLADISAFGGLPIYLAVMLFFLLFGNVLIFIQFAINLVLAYGVTTFFRLVLYRERPDKQRYANIIERIDASSFPSLHTMRATILALTIALYFQSTVVALCSALVIAGVACSRMMLLRHHASDVVAGIIIGAVNVTITLAILAPMFYQLIAGLIS